MKAGLLAGRPSSGPSFDFGTLSNLYGRWWMDDLSTSTVNTGADPDVLDEWWDTAGMVGFNNRTAVRPTITYDAVNGNNLASFNGNANGSCLDRGRIFDDDLFDIWIVFRGAAQVNKVLLSQHPGSALSGRTVFFGSDASAGTKGMLFFNNGSSFSMTTTTTVFDGSVHCVRITSNGSGTQQFEVDGGSAEGTSTGQTWTPYNGVFVVGATGSGTATNSGQNFAGDMFDIILTKAVQSSGVATALTDYLLALYAI